LKFDLLPFVLIPSHFIPVAVAVAIVGSIASPISAATEYQENKHDQDLNNTRVFHDGPLDVC